MNIEDACAANDLEVAIICGLEKTRWIRLICSRKLQLWVSYPAMPEQNLSCWGWSFMFAGFDRAPSTLGDLVVMAVHNAAETNE